MIRVWSDGKTAGVLDRLEKRGSTFAYDPTSDPMRAVSVTMPVRVKSWDHKFGLLPIFEMNLPEGALRARLLRQFAKATGRFDDLDLLSIVGRTQIGRLRYSGLKENLSEDVPFQSIDEILKARRGGELFAYLLERYAVHSGLSGVQPKVLIRATPDKISDPKVRHSPSIMSATHIVKMWDPDEFPELAANEAFCLEAAKAVGLPVPPFQMSDDGGALIIERFDLIDGQYMGFEDFCVLNGLGTADKYKGSYEARLFKRTRDFLAPEDAPKALEQLFILFALNCALRNGDAHLKNFGIIYRHVQGRLQLAPVYDLITTWAYIPQDPMALTLDGSTRWPDRKRLLEHAQVRCSLTPKRSAEILESVADGLATVAPKVRSYFKTAVPEVGERMQQAWETGIAQSLGLSGRLTSLPTVSPKKAPAGSEMSLIGLLQENDGTIEDTIHNIAAKLDLPASTLSAAIRRMAARGKIKRKGRRLTLNK